MKYSIGYRYIEDDCTPIMYFPMQRTTLEISGGITDEKVKDAIVNSLDVSAIDRDKIKYIEWWEA